jgi:hypothetical protein
MGKRTRLREAQRHAAEQAIAARLRAHSRRDNRPAFIMSYGEFPLAYRERIEPYRGLALRAPEEWRCRLRCRAPERRFLDLVEFAFARYPVADHLKQAWIDASGQRDALAAALAGADANDVPDLRRWYIVAAQGLSLYQHGARRYLTRIETHHFVAAPVEVSTTVRAFWFALARAAADDAVARKVARSRLADFPVASPFWRDAARFFARNPVPVFEMNDLIDYFVAARQDDPAYSLKGRSLPALRRRMAQWHRTLQEIAGGGRWQGHRLPDAVYSDGHGEPVWRFRQIKTGEELAREGRRMAHCVVTYRDKCVRGDSSIWSLTAERPAGTVSPRLTIELSRERAIVQCRGFANRSATPEEIAVVKRWAAEHGLTWEDWLW